MRSAILMLALLAAIPVRADTDPCAQPGPAEMAKAAGVTLPKLPWHLTNIIWDFEQPVEGFESLEVDVTIDRDVPSTYNLYIAPCGTAHINGLQFYGGLQTNLNGWVPGGARERVHAGRGGIFSRWSSDRKTPLSLDHVKPAAPDCLVESAGYEGEFASVRRPFGWGRGTYTWSVSKGAAEEVDGRPSTWFQCRVKDHANPGEIIEIGSLRFEGADFTLGPRQYAFVEVYATARIPHSGIPKVEVRFGWPRVNGRPAALKMATAYYPDTGPAGPDCAKARADGATTVVEVGPIFKRDEAQRRHPLELKRGQP